jgi:hypothetical protein
MVNQSRRTNITTRPSSHLDNSRDMDDIAMMSHGGALCGAAFPAVMTDPPMRLT